MKRLGVLLCAAMLAGAARYETSGPESEAFTQPIEGLDAESCRKLSQGERHIPAGLGHRAFAGSSRLCRSRSALQSAFLHRLPRQERTRRRARQRKWRRAHDGGEAERRRKGRAWRTARPSALRRSAQSRRRSGRRWRRPGRRRIRRIRCDAIRRRDNNASSTDALLPQSRLRRARAGDEDVAAQCAAGLRPGSARGRSARPKFSPARADRISSSASRPARERSAASDSKPISQISSSRSPTPLSKTSA